MRKFLFYLFSVYSVVTKQNESLSSLILIGEIIFKIADIKTARQKNKNL